MNPAWSVIFFTTLIGWAQGLVVALSIGTLAGRAPTRELLLSGLIVAIVLSIIALGCSFLHLGRPERAWRAAMMWRTSWLSREVIVVPAFIGWIALWLLRRIKPAKQCGVPAGRDRASAGAMALHRDDLRVLEVHPRVVAPVDHRQLCSARAGLGCVVNGRDSRSSPGTPATRSRVRSGALP